jgi:uncharacterized protein
MLHAGLNAMRALVRWLIVLPVRFYQLVIGPMLPKVCRFQPSCSDYFIQAVEKYGPMRGSIKGVCRICRCHPWGRSGYDPP